MQKGEIPIGIIITLVAVVLVFGILIDWFWSKASFDPLGYLLNLFSLGNTPNAPEATQLEAAIECSYYRCTEGCEGADVKKLQNPTGGSPFNCTSFCQKIWTDNGQADGKICGDSAKAHPVTAIVGSTTYGGQKLTLANLGFSSCMLESNQCGSPASGRLKFVYIQTDSVSPNTETKTQCAFSTQGTTQGYTSLVMTAGTYKIWTTASDALGATGQSTYVCSQ